MVIVSTEQALAAIPKGMRKLLMALGAKPWRKPWLGPHPHPFSRDLNGLHLGHDPRRRQSGSPHDDRCRQTCAISAYGPSFPYLHLDRKFMHLGFHIYDMGFQSPNIEAAMPMVFVTTLLLLAIVMTMTSGAIFLRYLMHKKVHLSKL